jgi:hypothetical protein
MFHEPEEKEETNPYLTKNEVLQFLYIKSICHRQLGQKALAIQEYSKLTAILTKEEND